MNSTVKTFITVVIIFLSRFALSISIGQSLLLGALIASILWYIGDEKFRHLPPGPLQIPLISDLHFLLQKDLNMFMYKLHQKYGPIVNIQSWGKPYISVSDYEMIKEMSVHPDLQLRPSKGIFIEFNRGLGIVSSEGNQWKQQRRFVLHALRDSGMGRLNMQEKIHDELEKVCAVMDKSEGKAMHVKQLLEKSTANIIFALAFNKQYEYDNAAFMARITAMEHNFKTIEKLAILESFPFVYPFLGRMRKQILDNADIMKDQSTEFIEEHRATLDPNNPRDLLDLYLIEMDKDVKDEDDDDGYHKTFFEEQLKSLISDFFLAGAETSSTTIAWALLYMLHYPDVQKKVQKEIDDVVGTERNPKMEDRLNLPYTAAALQEVERLGSAVPRGLLRNTGKTLKYRNYIFPKRTDIEFSLHAVHRDPKLWDEPFKFNPSRFIDSNGKVFRPPYLVPFGNGKRSCVGEALAKMEIFLYFATLLQNFTFEAQEKGNPPSIEPVAGFVRGPKNYRLRCVRRNR